MSDHFKPTQIHLTRKDGKIVQASLEYETEEVYLTSCCAGCGCTCCESGPLSITLEIPLTPWELDQVMRQIGVSP